MNSTASKPRTVRCPACGGPSLYAAQNPYRPFCSERCKNLDFGAWASESYRVPARPDSAGAEDPDTPPVH
ncbi:DNA gyrase inhibitor YacG [Caldimonas caldifontis]|uniref:DNA gyrase inhibitor YacG n=1 Tax=Caldimonas caldifontis TaxID=1452508 RepID=A0A2S5SSS2_9BURK|nr:DNA gyrase inhibitor YacG [Caldimonas caldifontis]PPE65790.1 DNA gyrase inhibitor YacG [Caldimonas caldifontis]